MRIRLTTRRTLALVGLVTPFLLVIRAIQQEREMAMRADCRGSIGTIALHLHNYHAWKGSFPPGTIPNTTLPPQRRLSWMVDVQPYFGGPRLEVIGDRTRGWDEAPNWPPTHRFSYMECKNETRGAVIKPLTYVGIAGLGPNAAGLASGHRRAGVFGYDRVTRLSEITDGTSQTMLLAETSAGLGTWTAGGPSSVRGVDPTTRPYVGSGRPFGGYHPGGANVAMADGSVKFVRYTVDPKCFEAASTISGAEPLLPGWHR